MVPAIASSQTPKPDEVREFWPNYSLPMKAKLYPGNQRSMEPVRVPRFQLPDVVPMLSGRLATDHARDIFKDPFPSDNFTLEVLLVHHVNKPVAAAIYSHRQQPDAPSFLLSYESEHDGGPAQIKAELLRDNSRIRLNHQSDGSLAFQEYWYHILFVARDGGTELFVNGKPEFVLEQTDTDALTKTGERCQLDIATYTDQEPFMQLSNVVKWTKLYRRPLSSDEIQHAYDAARQQIEGGIKYPDLFHFAAGPYLNFATKNSINVLWETNYPATAEVHYGLTQELGGIIKVQGPSDKSVADKRVFIQEACIDGLSPDTQYFYNVKLTTLDGEKMESDVLTFKTAVNDDQAFMFAAIGDTETRPHINDQLAKRIWGERPNFVLHLGDLTDGGKQDHKWQWNLEYFEGMNQLNSRIPVFPVAGNGEGDLYWYEKYHVLPGKEAYYNFTYGNAEFFMLNSNRRSDQFKEGGEQYQWLDEQLGTSTARWKFVALHHAPYSTDEDDYGNTWENSRGDQGDLKVRPLVPLFEKHNVDVVFFGHLHSYSRMGPIRENRINNKNGVTYIQSGGAGGNTEDFAPGKAWFAQKVFAGHHYCLINVNDDQLTLKMYDVNGNLGDYLELKNNREMGEK
jgi:predicted phosphodiesterase